MGVEAPSRIGEFVIQVRAVQVFNKDNSLGIAKEQLGDNSCTNHIPPGGRQALRWSNC